MLGRGKWISVSWVQISALRDHKSSEGAGSDDCTTGERP